MSVIKYTDGDIFKTECTFLVNPINTKRAMGKGLAKVFREKYPLMFEDYVTKCDANKVRVGYPYLFTHTDYAKKIIMFPTKDHWNYPSKLAWIEQGLENLVLSIPTWKVDTLALPALGCGEGGLRFDHVLEIIEKTLGLITINPPKIIEVYKPHDGSK